MAEMKIHTKQKWNWRDFFFQWEWFLVLIFIVVNIFNSFLSPYYFSFSTFINTPTTFLDKAFLVFPMMFILILGSIDISVASTVALSSVIMAVSYNSGLSMPLAIVLCFIVSTVCGFFNGLILVKFKELPAVIVTLSTQIIYRGIAYIILGDQASGKFPAWFSFFGWGSIGGIPFILLCFIVCAIIFAIVLHKTSFGRKLYGMGNNITACVYSGVNTDQIILIVFTLTGFMAGVTSIFLTSRMGSTRPNVALGYEMEVIAMVVLGGVSTSGGIGRIGGPILAIFIIGFLSYGLGLINIPAQVVLIVIGLLLILSVLALKVRISPKRKKSV
ncbi:MAG TPA: ABC transporter permease [Spirochaetia bacterium]|nr:ABC transporter permease [Spirochaetia bacterium]